MIDTIILRIHGVRKYRSIEKTLDPTGTNGYTTSAGKVDGKEIQRLRDSGIHNTGEILDIMRMNKTGEFLVKTKFSKHQNASNHYTFAYMVNHTANYIEFNFSLPKYIYGSNVLLFVDHISDRNFAFSECWQLEPNFERAADRFQRFINDFFRVEFPLTEIDYRDIEVNRIDVCFNQLFRTKEDALKYLSYQKRKQKKYTREGSNAMQDWDTSLMYKTGRYSAKIYHKGTMFPNYFFCIFIII
jgi:hypothetical protein